MDLPAELVDPRLKPPDGFGTEEPKPLPLPKPTGAGAGAVLDPKLIVGAPPNPNVEDDVEGAVGGAVVAGVDEPNVKPPLDGAGADVTPLPKENDDVEGVNCAFPPKLNAPAFDALDADELNVAEFDFKGAPKLFCVVDDDPPNPCVEATGVAVPKGLGELLVRGALAPTAKLLAGF